MGVQLQTKKRAALQPSFTQAQIGLLQRARACGQHTIAGEECVECRKKRERMIQYAAVSAASVHAVPPIVYEVFSTPGQPLDEETRAFMEPRFRHDFSQVRVHTDAKAAESARAVNALAYTVGRDVVFEIGQYKPETSEGRGLLAHELAHVIQQRGQPSSTQPKLQLNELGDTFEKEADHVSAAIAAANSKYHQQDTGGEVKNDDHSELEFVGSKRENRLHHKYQQAGESSVQNTKEEVITESQNLPVMRMEQCSINIHRLPLLQRKAEFVPGPVKPFFNPAKVIHDQPVQAEFGRTQPVLNGRTLYSDDAAVDVIDKPYIAGKTSATGEAECWVSSVPTNKGSFEELVMKDPPWSYQTNKMMLAMRFRLIPCIKAESGGAAFIVKGDPTDEEVAAGNLVHEDHHARDNERMFAATILKWDVELTKAYNSKQIFRGADITACEAALFKAMGGTPDQIAKNFFNACLDARDAFHASPAGKTGPWIEPPACDANCNTVWTTLSNY